MSSVKTGELERKVKIAETGCGRLSYSKGNHTKGRGGERRGS